MVHDYIRLLSAAYYRDYTVAQFLFPPFVLVPRSQTQTFRKKSEKSS